MSDKRGKLVAIKGGKEKFEGGSGKKRDHIEAENIVFNMLCGNKTELDELGMDCKFDFYLAISNTSQGSGILMHQGDDVYKAYIEEEVSSEVYAEINHKILMEDPTGEEVRKFSSNSVSSGVKTWVNLRNRKFNKKILDEFPKNFRFASEPGACFARLPYDPVFISDEDLEEKAPIFYKTINRISNKEAFVKKIGSMFYGDAHRKQSLWLYGESDGGKSGIQNMISELLGGLENTVSFSEEDLKDKFFKETLVGKGLWIVREADPKFLNKPVYKSLTGDDDHLINPKGRRQYSVELKGHFLFSSNEKPEIRNEGALLKRVIPCNCGVIPEEERISSHELKRRFREEMGYIAGYCMRKYEESGKGHIEFNNRELLDAIEEGEEGYYSLLNQHFEMDFVKDPKNPDEYKHSVESSYVMQMLFPNANHNSPPWKEFRNWLISKGCEIKTSRFNSRTTRRYFYGLRKLTSSEYKEMKRIDV